jgi:hypothetical protein
MHKIEVIVDKAIPPCLVVLLAVIIIELGFHGMIAEYKLALPITIADYTVICVFVVDLIFKYMRTRHLPKFFRRYWLDILAVFPFFLLFRIYELAFGAASLAVSEGAHTAQIIVHEGLEVEKEGAKILSEAEKLAKMERSTRLARFMRPLARIPRFFKALPEHLHFYNEPTGGHHNREYMPKRRVLRHAR